MADPATALDPIAYLTARLDEDEAAARACAVSTWTAGVYCGLDYYAERGMWEISGPTEMTSASDPEAGAESYAKPDAEHIARWDPVAVLADIAAKRAMLTPHAGYHDCLAPGTDCSWTTSSAFRDIVLPALVAPYAARPDFPTEWKINA